MRCEETDRLFRHNCRFDSFCGDICSVPIPGAKFVRESKGFASVHFEVTRSRHVFVLGPEAEVDDDKIAEDCTWASEGRRFLHRQIQLVLLRDVSSEQRHVLTIPGYPIDADPFVVLQDHATGEIDPEAIQFIVQQLLVCVLCELPIPQAEAIVRAAVSAAGQQIEPAAARLVAERAGTDIARLRGDLDKLLLFAAGKPKIVLADVHEIVSVETSQDDWAVTNAIGRGDAKEALRQMAMLQPSAPAFLPFVVERGP